MTKKKYKQVHPFVQAQHHPHKIALTSSIVIALAPAVPKLLKKASTAMLEVNDPSVA